MSGRAYLYGLGAAGEAGVDHVLDLLSSDMRRTMALIGCSAAADLGRGHVSFTPRPGPPASDGAR
jgi:L-lactate dehydrogenase (cytochrome)